jgi:hypothetical protein
LTSPSRIAKLLGIVQMSGSKTNRYGIGNYTWPSSFLGDYLDIQKGYSRFQAGKFVFALTLLQLQELLVQSSVLHLQ